MKKNEVDISIVMPVYNCEDYLTEAIESMLSQTFSNFEFIIVCEYGTNEKSMEIVTKYASQDSRIIIIKNKTRLGISASINEGIKIANGKYIARMDSDDISARRRLEIQKLYMDTYSDIGLCGIRHRVIGDPNWIVDYSANPEYLKCDLLFMSPLRHPSIMIRKSVIDQYGLWYDTNLEGVEDYELYIRASKYINLSNILEDDLFYHRRSDKNLSLIYRERDNEIQTNLLKIMYKEQLGLNLSDKDIRRLSVVTFLIGCSKEQYISELKKLNDLLLLIKRENDKKNVYDTECLENAFHHRWMRALAKLKVMCGGQIPNNIYDEWRKGTYYKKWMN